MKVRDGLTQAAYHMCGLHSQSRRAAASELPLQQGAGACKPCKTKPHRPQPCEAEVDNSNLSPLPLSLQLSPYVSELSLYDIAGTPGVAADVSHINSKARVRVRAGGREEGRGSPSERLH